MQLFKRVFLLSGFTCYFGSFNNFNHLSIKMTVSAHQRK